MHTISRILYPAMRGDNHLPCFFVTKEIFAALPAMRDTALHPRIDLAVSLLLKGFVTVRTTPLARDGGYPLRFIEINLYLNVRTFLTSRNAGSRGYPYARVIYSILLLLCLARTLVFVLLAFLLHI